MFEIRLQVRFLIGCSCSCLFCLKHASCHALCNSACQLNPYNCFHISSFTHLKFRNHVTIKTEKSADFFPAYLFSSRLSHLEMKLTLTMTALLSILHRLLSYPVCVCIRHYANNAAIYYCILSASLFLLKVTLKYGN